MSVGRGLSLGIGLTNACNLSCGHCYRPRGEVLELGLGDVERCLELFAVGSVNLGTGENILSPALRPVLDTLFARGIPTSLTSNGLSLLELDAERLARLHDVEVSFDFATAAEMDAFRGAGAWALAVRAVERCALLGLRVTLLAVMMRNNHDKLAAVARLAASFGAPLRVNVYQPVHEGALAPTWEELWGGFRRLFAEAALVTCTEPMLGAVLAEEGIGGEPADTASGSVGAPAEPGGCGRTSLRLTPAGDLLPCVYWPRSAARLRELDAAEAERLWASPELTRSRVVPRTCQSCRLAPRCGGGCAARRELTVGIDEPDPYCPLARGALPTLGARLGAPSELLHAANVCTTIVRGDGFDP